MTATRQASCSRVRPVTRQPVATSQPSCEPSQPSSRRASSPKFTSVPPSLRVAATGPGLRPSITSGTQAWIVAGSAVNCIARKKWCSRIASCRARKKSTSAAPCTKQMCGTAWMNPAGSPAMPLATAWAQNCFECSNCSKIDRARPIFTLPSASRAGV